MRSYDLPEEVTAVMQFLEEYCILTKQDRKVLETAVPSYVMDTKKLVFA